MNIDASRRTVNGVYLQPTPFLIARLVSPSGYASHDDLLRLLVEDREQRGLSRVPETLHALRSAVHRLNHVLAKSGERVLAVQGGGYCLKAMEGAPDTGSIIVAPSRMPSVALVSEIAAEEGAKVGLQLSEVMGRRRTRRHIWARKRVIERLDRLGFGPSAIGMRLNLDHATVLHHLERPSGPMPAGAAEKAAGASLAVAAAAVFLAPHARPRPRYQPGEIMPPSRAQMMGRRA